ncbi:MAG: formylglycine-generating enzyme family protein [Deltaproteobacteria bacterium]|nr:formylglycine-generating enzyme family protein [Deltaproteobacteria bacterium]
MHSSQKSLLISSNFVVLFFALALLLVGASSCGSGQTVHTQAEEEPSDGVRPIPQSQAQQVLNTDSHIISIVKNSSGMSFVLIYPGEFTMGAGEGFQGDGLYERPPHKVAISRAFRLSIHEVTQRQWLQVMGTEPSFRKGPHLPVENVSYQDALDFIEKLNAREAVKKYRLPTEAEWEYAARAGRQSAYHFGDSEKDLPTYGWCGEGIVKGKPHVVGQLSPNAWGLYDMHGNVSEWVGDWFDEEYYAESVKKDPQGPKSGTEKVHRGGGWASDPKSCQAAWREFDLPTVRSRMIGFRVAYTE